MADGGQRTRGRAQMEASSSPYEASPELISLRMIKDSRPHHSIREITRSWNPILIQLSVLEFEAERSWRVHRLLSGSPAR